jgi:hypothetical protein
MKYIILKKPNSVDSKQVKDEIKKLIKSGYKTNQILWKMEFTTTDKIVKSISDKFQVIKNRIAFEERNK